ncbi:MAG: hypothetical protein OXH09_20835, partial [Gammaproteobacteria bacterium]|nr:hypothetical protein [Gammaproteobacteria bacterium]
GVPFRDKIYAVFPGFEPSFRDGKEGLHLLFLFDPEIGLERYLRAFEVVMGGISPWRDGGLQVSGNRAAQAFEALRGLWERERSGEGEGAWRYLVLAPHIEASKGLLGAQKAQVLQLFDHEEITGLELGDEQLPVDTLQKRPWLHEGMEQHRQAFFHASDAYGLDDVGRRHTWVKLASPHVEALRQAFVASDSRIMIGFAKDEAGKLKTINNPPDITLNDRPWLREVRVSGGASFFGGSQGGTPRTINFRLSPDLTCVVGGSMTGKSTLLDGLRCHIGVPKPVDETVRANVDARGRIFAAGAPEIVLDCPGTDPTAALGEQWPAQFFAQNELQRLTQEGAAVEDILARLVPSETAGIAARNDNLRRLDKRLSNEVEQLRDLDDQLEDAEQALLRARTAKDALAAFSEAGVDRLHRASRDRQLWAESNRTVSSVGQSIRDVIETANAFEVPQLDLGSKEEPRTSQIDVNARELASQWASVVGLLQGAERAIGEWAQAASSVVDALKADEAAFRTDVQRVLAERGLDVTKLQEFQKLSRQAALVSSHQANYDQLRERRNQRQDLFDRLQGERQVLIDEQRKAFDRVAQGIQRQFDDRIRVRRMDSGDLRSLDGFLEQLRQRGVTRWWNGLEPDQRPSPPALSEALASGSLAEVGMSDAVRQTFRETMTRAKQRELVALRCPDRYILELRMDDGTHRRLEELSGGQRVSVLLSLLLETTDDRPLVIDQPEDELDSRFLFDTVLPALKRLRGRRQLIVATHDANIVVNGDADMVIQLEASASRGRVACAGAIEEAAVRDAIVRTVDGGKEAFRLRRRKYGF